MACASLRSTSAPAAFVQPTLPGHLGASCSVRGRSLISPSPLVGSSRPVLARRRRVTSPPLLASVGGDGAASTRGPERGGVSAAAAVAAPANFVSSPAPPAVGRPRTDVKPAAAADDPAHVFRNEWYPIFYLRDLDRTKPSPFWLYGWPLVAWWAGSSASGLGGTLGSAGGGPTASPSGWSVLDDVCPHRAAPLSEGRVSPAEEGNPASIECTYHVRRRSNCYAFSV